MNPKIDIIFKNNILLFFFLLPILSSGQGLLIQKSTFLKTNLEENIILKDTSKFRQTTTKTALQKQHTLWLKFEVPKNFLADSALYLFVNKQAYIELFQITNSGLEVIAKAGFFCPKYKRSVIEDISFIRLETKHIKSNRFLLKIKNYNIEPNYPELKLFTYIDYQAEQIKKNGSFVNKFGKPIFLGIIVLILIFSIIQYLIFREKVYFLYFLYIFFVFLRVLVGIGLLAFEDFSSYLRQMGFISSFLQSFSFLSLIAYLLFVRAFINTPVQAPKLDKYLQLQVVFLVFVLIFEAIFTIEKYIIPSYIFFYRGIEITETVLSLITLYGLFRLYNELNKYVILGVCFLFLVAFVGQEVVLSMNSFDRFRKETILQVLWGGAYIGEIIFFTIGLINRGAILQKTVEIQLSENQKLVDELMKSKQKDGENMPQTLSIPTSKGSIILQQTDIIRIEASGSYSIFFTNDRKQIVASYSLADFEPKLNPDKFLRVHKSHIVNLTFTNKYVKGDGGNLVLNDKSEIPVSRTRKKELLKKLLTV